MNDLIHILLVEDNPGDAELITEKLTFADLPFTCDVVDRLAKLPKVIEANNPDVILLDLGLPDSEGIDTVHRAKRLIPRGTPIVVLTGLGDKETGLATIRAGAQDYLSKQHAPPEELIRTIRYALERSQSKERERHLQAVLMGIRNVNQLITRERNPQVLIKEACRLLVESRGYRGIWIALAERQHHPPLWGEAGQPIQGACAAFEAGVLPQSWMTLSQGQKPAIVIGAERLAELLAPLGCTMDAVCTLTYTDTCYGLLGLLLPDDAEISEDEADLLQEVLGDIAFGLHDIEQEMLHQAAIEALKESEAQYRLLVENAKIGIAVHELVYDETGEAVDFRLLNVNPAYETQTGLVASEVVGRLASEFLPELRTTGFIELFSNVVATGEPCFTERYFEPLGRHYALNAYRVADHRFATIFLDTTERVMALKEQELLQEELRQTQKLEAIGQLAGGIAHDFNNLLSVIIGRGEIAKRQANGNQPLKDNIKQILVASDRAATLTRQLLAFSRKQPLKPEVLNLNGLVHNLHLMLQRLIGEHLTLEANLAPDLGNVKVDPGQIEQVIMNLCVNARDAMPDGGMLTIETSNVMIAEAAHHPDPDLKPGPHVCLTVSDTGCGIPLDIQERIFEPFFTTKETGKGTGLGLATVFGIVKQTGGSIWMESELGKGTTFTILLPRIETPSTMAAPDETVELYHAGGEHILVVEDETGMRELIKDGLTEMGYTITLARDGAAGLRLVLEGLRPDIILTDVVMPVMSGKTMMKEIRQNAGEIKVLYMSGYDGTSIVQDENLKEDTPIIQKPFRISKLAERIRELLDS